VIVTSFLFEDGELSLRRLQELSSVVSQEELVIDLSCRKTTDGYLVATNRWQTLTRTRVDEQTLQTLARHCSEFLVHAVDVEGLCRGIEQDLVALLGEIATIPCTYAGGGRALSDLQRVSDLSDGKVDLTFGSALDLFGGTLVKYADCVAYNERVLGKT
jgi:phosphoribosylformimino-5-aminoimidazole carboxamide ribotide isomerase